jgi:pilus assembly protein CpaB
MVRFRVDRKWWMLALALLAGGAAAWLSQRHIQARIEQLEDDARMPLVSVVVASADLAAGARITTEVVAVREMPAEWASPSAVSPEEFESIESTSLAYPVKRGEAILWAHVAPARALGFAERLIDGRRAVTIPVDEISSVSGLLQPGDTIDLYVSFEHKGNPVTVPLLQGMKVLATGRQVDASPRGTSTTEVERSFSTVTLDASLEEAVKLIAARQSGAITAMLRRPGDSKPAHAEYRGDLGKLLGLREPPVQTVTRKRTGVPVIYGDRPLRAIPKLGHAAIGDGQDPAVEVEVNANPPAADPTDRAPALLPPAPADATPPLRTHPFSGLRR